MLNDASWPSFGFFNNNIFPNRIAKKIFTIQYNSESNRNITVIKRTIWDQVNFKAL